MIKEEYLSFLHAKREWRIGIKVVWGMSLLGAQKQGQRGVLLVQGREEFQEHGTLRLGGCFKSNKILINFNHIRI